MKTPFFFYVFLVIILLAGCSQPLEGDLIITTVNIIDVESGEVLDSRDVVIAGEKIASIVEHTDGRSYKGEVIDGTGKYLIPGLWDMHAHIFWEWGPQLLRANGVTGIRSMHGGDRIKDIRENRTDGFYMGLEVSYSSPIVDGSSMWEGALEVHTPEEGRRIAREVAEAGYDFIKVYSFLDRETYFAIADEANRLGISIAGHIPIAVTLEEAIAAGQKSTEHSTGLLLYTSSERDHFYSVVRGETLDTSIMDGDLRTSMYKIARFEVEKFDNNRLETLADLLGKSDLWLCPTLVNLRAGAMEDDPDFLNDDRKQYLPREELEFWESPDDYPDEFKNMEREEIKLSEEMYRIHRSMLKQLLDGGAKFLAGTDIGNPNIYPGFSLHDELALFVETGFTPLQALQTATINPAVYLERSHELGTVEAGKRANLVLLNANPLQDIANTKKIEAVVTRGRFFDREALDKLLAGTERAAGDRSPADK
jgi:hypothetical protein